jgi:YVTN family beta-propeller protein
MLVFIACGNERSGNPLADNPDPAKPTGLKTELQPNAILLSWKPDANSPTYQIFRKPCVQKDGMIGTSNAYQFQDTAVVDGETYEYWVRGLGPGDELGPGLLGPLSDSVSRTFYKPQLELVGNPDKKLDFGTNLITLQLTFKNKGGGQINWEIPDEIPWVHFTPSKGSVGQEPFSVNAQVNRDMPVKIYEETTTIKGNLGEPVKLIVKMQIPNEPVLSAEPEKIELCQGEEDDINISNIGKGILHWEITYKAEWLTVTPLDGTVEEGESVTVRLQALEISALPNNKSVDVQIYGGPKEDPRSQEKSIIVTLLGLEPRVEISPNTVELKESNNWRTEIKLTNTSECSLSWEAAPTRTWLVVEPKNGRLRSGESQRIQVSGIPDSLDAGSHDAQISFTLNESHHELLDVTLFRTGYLRGRIVNIFTRRGIPEVTIDTDVGVAITDNNGNFEVPYEREGSYRWRAENPDFLSSEGIVSTSRAIGEIGVVSLIPIPQLVGDIDSNFGFDTPWFITLSDDERQGCIVNRDGSFVSIVDTQINREIDTVEVGKMPLSAVYAGGELFVANSWDNTVSVINPLERKVIATIEVVGMPAYLAACRGKLYVTLQDNIAGNRVAVIDISARRVERQIPVGKFPHGVAVDEFCQSLWVANHDDDTLSWVNLGSGVGPLIPVGPNPQGVAVSPDGTSVYSADAGRISCIDARSGNVVEQFSQPGARFGWVAVVQLPDDKGDLVYATDTAGDKLWMWHPASGQYASISVGSRPFGLAVMKGRQRVYVCCAEANIVQWLE